MNQLDKQSMLGTLWEILCLSFRIHKVYFLVAIFQCAILTLQTLLNSSLLSILLYFMEKYSFHKAIAGGIFLSFLIFFIEILGKLSKKLTKIHQNTMYEKLNHEIFSKMTRISYQYLENPEYLDIIEKARFAVNNEQCIDTLFHALVNLIQCGFTLAGLLCIVFVYDQHIVWLLFVTAIFNIILFYAFSKAKLEFTDINIVINRKFEYYLKILLDPGSAKDFRMYPIGKLLREKFHMFSEKMVQDYNHYLRKTDKIKSWMKIIQYLECIMIYLLLLQKMLQSKMEISIFVLLISSATLFSTTFSSIIHTTMSFYIGIKLTQSLVHLLKLPDEKKDMGNIKCSGDFTSLEFRNVTFCYPGMKEPTLKNISFRIEAGQKISVVGLNGAGKTSLVKLLCRFYVPEKGEILWNGISIWDYEYLSYIQKISTLFQDYRLFALSLEENVTGGCQPLEDVYSSLCKVGLQEKLNTLPKGLETVYSVVYGKENAEFSGGEVQKIALARALNKDSDLIILDEPTSAMDPLSEAEFYNHFNLLVQDRTVLYISHRMSSSIFCDKILLLENGTVSAFDSHEVLMKEKQELYYQLFMAQAKRYQI